MHSRRTRSAAALLVAAGVIGTTACGGSSGSASADVGTPAPAQAAAGATVKTLTVSGFGKLLANSAGRPLYMLTSDPAGGTKCTGSCTKKWHPLTVGGKATAGAGVKGNLLGTFKRSNPGGTQVMYAKHALFTYSGPGLVSGAGLKTNGGTWYLVAPTGKPIKTTGSGGY
jgi:predicted lipoprotein with Yx(FWY)xxD motif